MVGRNPCIELRKTKKEISKVRFFNAFLSFFINTMTMQKCNRKQASPTFFNRHWKMSKIRIINDESTYSKAFSTFKLLKIMKYLNTRHLLKDPTVVNDSGNVFCDEL